MIQQRLPRPTNSHRALISRGWFYNTHLAIAKLAVWSSRRHIRQTAVAHTDGTEAEAVELELERVAEAETGERS